MRFIMVRYGPLLFTIAGLLLFVGGFIYDIAYAGIPYQDPTPEMTASFAWHSNIATATRRSGVGTFLLGLAWGIMRLLKQKSLATR